MHSVAFSTQAPFARLRLSYSNVSSTSNRLRTVSFARSPLSRAPTVLCALSGAPPRGGGTGGHGRFGGYGRDDEGEPRGLLQSLMDTYSHLLRTRPYLTKAATMGILMMISDYLAQLLTSPVIEGARLLRYLVYGFLAQGPITHAWFELLDAHCLRGTVGVLQKVFLDQFIATPCMLALFVVYMHVMEGRRLSGAGDGLRAKHAKAFGVSVRVWPFINAVNFTIIPLALRVPFVAAVNVVWIAFLSVFNAANVQHS